MWLCARTHPNAEKIAIRNLINQEFDYYQPKILEKKLRKQKIQLVEQPLFPCYLFVQVTKNYRSLHSTHGIAAIINGTVRDQVVDSLRQKEVDGYIQLPKARALMVGDKVVINDGLFAGQQALVQRMPTKERQRILLELLSNKISVLIDEGNCIAA